MRLSLAALALFALTGCAADSAATASPVPTEPPPTTATAIASDSATAPRSPNSAPPSTDSAAALEQSDVDPTNATAETGEDASTDESRAEAAAPPANPPAPSLPAASDSAGSPPLTSTAGTVPAATSPSTPASTQPTTPTGNEAPSRGESRIEITVGPETASPNYEPSPTPANDPQPVSEETALAVNEAYYALIEEMNAMFADPSGSYDWERVAVEPIRSALANEQAERLRFGQVVRWPVDSVYTDVILGTSVADPVVVDGTALGAVRVDTCVVDDAIDTYPAENIQVDQGPVTRWITLIMVNDGGWKVSSLESSNEIEGIAPCGIGGTP